MLARLTSIIAIVVLITTSCGDHLMTTRTPEPTVAPTPKPTALSLADLIKSGKLRAAFNQLNIACVQTNARGEAGLCVEIAAELATQLHTTLITSTYNNGAVLMDAGRAGDWDVAFVSLDFNIPQPGMNATAAYLEIEQTYLVPGDSPYNSVADLDRQGVRIASFSPSAIEVFLKQNLKYATVIDVPSIAHAVTLIEQHEAEAYAGSRDEVDDGGWRLAGGRVLSDSITRFRWGVVIASGRSDLFAYVTQFLETAKRSGFIQDAIETTKVSGARVAP
ncbi:MAG TPA: transporter substrate-binding domain-containing protein [Candidatus Limnocylindria bacterium]